MRHVSLLSHIGGNRLGVVRRRHRIAHHHRVLAMIADVETSKLVKVRGLHRRFREGPLVGTYWRSP